MICFIKSAIKKEDFPETDKEVVFVGRSNVGKSSLLNALYKKGLAYTGKTPGKTRLINFFNINDEYTAVDVPGYGFARRSRQEAIQFGEMMEAYFSRKDKIALTIMIVDSRIGLTADDLDMKEFLEEKGIDYLIVANKIDKLSNNELMNNKHRLFKDIENIVFVSSLKRKNLEQIKEYIDKSIRTLG